LKWRWEEQRLVIHGQGERRQRQRAGGAAAGASSARARQYVQEKRERDWVVEKGDRRRMRGRGHEAGQHTRVEQKRTKPRAALPGAARQPAAGSGKYGRLAAQREKCDAARLEMAS